jgi:hypothetical protein
LFLRYAAVLVSAYLGAWTAACGVVLLTRGDGLAFTHFFEYLRLAWTFTGGELPSFIRFFSVIAFLPLAGLAIFVLRRYERRHSEAA